MKETLAAIGLGALIVLVGKIALNRISKKLPKRKQHDHKLNPHGFDDGNEDDNTLHSMFV